MASRSLGKLTLQMMAETGQFKRGMTDAEKATDALTNSQKRAEAQVDRLISSIDPMVGEYMRLDKQLQQLQKHHKAGLIDAAQFDYYKSKLSDTRKALDGHTVAQKGNAMSAKEMAFAMRGLPAQFTDIVVSLQGGQRPLTVLLQQGGQLKDMFGGIGPAIKAMGTYVAGLISPFSLAAGGIAAMTLAYYLGSKEADAFRQAVLLTGNAAGTNADQLASAAARIDNYTGTQYQAAEALSLVAKTGKFTGGELEKVAGIAVLMNNVTNKAIDETVSEFEKLAKDPTKAVAELNEQYHFLTAGIYENIAALVKEGKQTEAVKLAMESYSDALMQRTTEITQNLGYIESAWKAIKIGAAESWDEMLNIGRDTTLEQQLTDVGRRIQETIALGEGEEDEAKRRKLVLERLFAERDGIEAQLKAARDLNEEQQQQAALQQKSIQAQQKINDLVDKSLTKDEQRTKAYKELNQWVNQIRAADPNSQLVNESAIAKYKQLIDEQFKDSKKPERESRAAELTLEKLRQQAATLQEQLTVNQKLGSATQALIEFNQRIADIKNKQVLSADEKSLLANQTAIQVQLAKNAAIEEEFAKREKLARMDAFNANLDANLNTVNQQHNDEYQAFGLGNAELERLRAMQQIEREVQRQKDRSLQGYIKGDPGQEEYQQQLQSLDNYLNQRLSQEQGYYDKLDSLRSDWKNGAKSALSNYLDSAKDVAGQTENLFNNAFSSMEDAIVQFAMTGKLSFSDFTKSILADLARIAARQALVNMLASIVGAAFGTTSSQTTSSSAATITTTGGFSSGGYTGDGGKYQPAGIVHKGEVVFSQEDVARHGGVASVERIRKGFKGFADGGVVGGNYAAVTPTNNNGGGVSITQHIKVDSGDHSTTEDRNKLGKAYAKAADQGARNEIAKQLKPGGLIWAAMRGYT